MIVDAQEASAGARAHWLLYGVAVSLRGLPEGVPPLDTVENIGIPRAPKRPPTRLTFGCDRAGRRGQGTEDSRAELSASSSIQIEVFLEQPGTDAEFPQASADCGLVPKGQGVSTLQGLPAETVFQIREREPPQIPVRRVAPSPPRSEAVRPRARTPGLSQPPAGELRVAISPQKSHNITTGLLHRVKVGDDAIERFAPFISRPSIFE